MPTLENYLIGWGCYLILVAVVYILGKLVDRKWQKNQKKKIKYAGNVGEKEFDLSSPSSSVIHVASGQTQTVMVL